MCRLVAKLLTHELPPQREKVACGRLGQRRQHEDEDGKSTSTLTSATRSTEKLKQLDIVNTKYFPCHKKDARAYSCERNHLRIC